MSDYTVVVIDGTDLYNMLIIGAPDMLTAVLAAEQNASETATALIAYEGAASPVWKADKEGIASLEAHAMPAGYTAIVAA